MRLIDADKAVERIKEWLDQTRAIPLDTSYYFELIQSCIEDCPTIDAVPVELLVCNEDCPTIDAVPVVRGKWKPIFKGADTCECSVCKSEGFSDSDFGFIATPYCPNCGAKMEVEP